MQVNNETPRRHGMAGFEPFILGTVTAGNPLGDPPVITPRLRRIIDEAVADMEPDAAARALRNSAYERNEERRRALRERSPGFEGGDIVPLNAEELQLAHRARHPQTTDYVIIGGQQVHEDEVTTQMLYEEYRRMIEGARPDAQ